MRLYEYTAHQLSQMLAAGEISSVELTTDILQRISEAEPKVQAYLCVKEDFALEQAKAVDKKRRAGAILGPLAGIPYALKDNMATEGIATTCASRMLENFRPPYNATVYRELMAADAVLLGKLNMDEFAMGSSTENSYFKATRNPNHPDHVPGGSSGGSAAAVAAQEAIFTLGTDTGGSIRQPASFCGVVGLKPTYGLVSRFGVVAFASSLDQVGPLTKDVEDCALVLQAIATKDDLDGTSLDVKRPKYSQNLAADMKGLKIGLPKEYFGEGIAPSTRDAVLAAAKKMEEQGAIVEECSLPHTEYALAAYYIISSAEASSNLARYDGIKYGYRASQYEDLVDLYRQSRSQGFGPEVKRRIMLGTFALSAGYFDAYYKKAQQVRTLICQGFDKAFHDFDVLLTPVVPNTAWKIGEKVNNPLEMYAADICTVSINVAGLCGLSVPCGKDEKGLPIGAQLIGRPLDESRLLQVGYAMEKALGDAVRGGLA